MDLTRSARWRLMSLGAVISLTSIFQMGYSNCYVNTSIESFRHFLNDSLTSRGLVMNDQIYSWTWSFILNSWLPGFAIGTWCALPVTDRCGRRTARRALGGLLCGNFLTSMAIGLMTTGIVFGVAEMLLLGRFFTAIGSGISMASLILFLQEISPAAIRGMMSFYAEMSFVATNAVGAVLGMSSLLGDKLSMLVGIALIPTALSLVVLLPLHETPKFLLVKRGNREDAKTAARFYLNVNENDKLEEFLDSIDEKDDGGDGGEEGTESTESVLKQCLTVPHVRLGLLLGILSLQLTSSIWPMVFYSTEFLRRANVDFTLAEYCTSLMLVLSTLATIFGVFLIERFSRRSLFIRASAVNLCSLLLFFVFSRLQKSFDAAKYGCVLAMIAHGISYSFATGPIAWFITAELVSTQFRSTCQTISLSVNHFLAFILTLITLPLYDTIDSYTVPLLFVLPPCVCLIALYRLLPETKGRDIQEIINHLRMTVASHKRVGGEVTS